MTGLVRPCRAAIVLLGLASACGPPKEAQDPRDILGDEFPADPETPSGAPLPAGGSAERENPAPRAPRDPPATRAECQAAAERMVDLGLRAAAVKRDTPDSAASLSADERAEIVGRAVEECLAWKTPRSEAQCVARANEERDIDRCVAK